MKGFGFTKENELFVGRVAQLGFAAGLIGEAVTGVGPLAQLGLETGIPLRDAEPILLISIILTLVAAINEVCTIRRYTMCDTDNSSRCGLNWSIFSGQIYV